MIAWDRVQTVLLDMDGTLLDLHFDNHFWREHVPRRYAAVRGMDPDAARTELYERYRRVEGTLDWYCVDYWSRELGLDVVALKREVEHLIALRPHVVDFLGAARAAGKRLVLVTNAHAKALALKLARTRLDAHLDAIVCAHDLGAPKEHRAFWRGLQCTQPFDRRTAVLIDDSLPVLRAARAYGIAQVCTIERPDSRQPQRPLGEFPAIASFRDVMPG